MSQFNEGFTQSEALINYNVKPLISRILSFFNFQFIHIGTPVEKIGNRAIGM